MKFKDQLVRCGACGKQFVFTVREQRRRAEAGQSLDVPAFCTECRGADVRLAEVSAAPVPEAGTVARRTSSPEQRPARASSRGGGGRGARTETPSRSGSARRSRAATAKPAAGPGAGRRTRRGPGARQPLQTELRIRYTGTVKWFDEERGYGFIDQEEGGEVFVHCSSVLSSGPARLEKGQPVEFEVERTERGLHALDVVPLSW